MSTYSDASLILPVAPEYKAGKIYSLKPTDGTGDFDFSRATEATIINKDGLIETVGSNIPRLNYPMIDGVVSGCPSLLLEPQSTNLIPYSEDFSQGIYSLANGGTGSLPVVTTNYAISPDGTLNANRIQFDIGSGTTASDLCQFQANVSETVSNTYTTSIYLKSNDANSYDMILLGVSGGKSLITITSEWQRFETTEVATGATSLRLRLRGNEGTSKNADVLAWGLQEEELSYATSYIPTQGSSVTRVAETASKSGLSNYINSSEGVLYAEISALNDDTTPVFVSLSDDSTNNRFSIYFQDTRIRAFTIQNNSSTISFSNTTVNVSEFHKIALSYTNDNAKLFIDGSLIDTIDLTSVAFSANLSAVRFDNGGGGSDFYGKVKDLRVYNQALTDTELIALTS